MFQIIVNYDTGDSFSQCLDQTEVIGKWKSEELAIENARRLKEHYEIYNRCSSNYFGEESLTEKEAIDLIKTKDWCPVLGEKEKKSHIVDFCMLHSVNLQLDDGTWRRFGTSTWCGYFESVNSINVENTKTYRVYER